MAQQEQAERDNEEMSEGQKIIHEIRELEGNSVCADCAAPGALGNACTPHHSNAVLLLVVKFMLIIMIIIMAVIVVAVVAV